MKNTRAHHRGQQEIQDRDQDTDHRQHPQHQQRRKMIMQQQWSRHVAVHAPDRGPVQQPDVQVHGEQQQDPAGHDRDEQARQQQGILLERGAHGADRLGCSRVPIMPRHRIGAAAHEQAVHGQPDRRQHEEREQDHVQDGRHGRGVHQELHGPGADTTHARRATARQETQDHRPVRSQERYRADRDEDLLGEMPVEPGPEQQHGGAQAGGTPPQAIAEAGAQAKQQAQERFRQGGVPAQEE